MWKVFSTQIDTNRKIYRVYRIINPKEAMHAGNIETTGIVHNTRAEAQAEADRLNRKESL